MKYVLKDVNKVVAEIISYKLTFPFVFILAIIVSFTEAMGILPKPSFNLCLLILVWLYARQLINIIRVEIRALKE